MADRFTSGFKLYQKGKVRMRPQTHKEFVEFDVDGSNGKVYRVEFDLKEGTARCSLPGCPDYENRSGYAADSFLCKHILAGLFKLAEIKGVGSQVPLEVPI